MLVPIRCCVIAVVVFALFAQPMFTFQIEPIILFPGLSGSLLEAKLSHVEGGPHWICQKNSDWELVWFKTIEFIDMQLLECAVFDMFLTWNSTSKEFEGTKGVEVRGKDFGGIEGVAQFGQNSYFGLMINYFVSNFGYVAGKSIRGAPYDWRWTGLECSTNGIYAQVQKLVEDTYEMNSQTRVNLLGHSMGGPWLHYFLQNFVTQDWKDKYISRFWGLAGAWLGAPYASFSLASGPPTGFRGSSIVNDWLVGMPSVNWMVPRPPFFDINAVPIAQTPEGTFTMNQFAQRYWPQNSFEIYENYNAIQAFAKVNGPGVDVACVHGYGIPTPSVAKYNVTVIKPGVQPFDFVYVDGDGVVPETTLDWCNTWTTTNHGHEVLVLPYFNATHDDIVRMPVIWELISSYVVKK
eukprot:ANDGO_01773.mRNA.1 Lecithin-cholesterol acyltransferase-like 1